MKIIGGPPDLARLLSEHQKEDDEGEAKNPCPEAQVMTLKEVAEDYFKGPGRFKVGDLVTPRPGTNIKGAGEPAIVVEVNPDAKPNFQRNESDSDGSPRFGAKYDVRLLRFLNGTLLSYWEESWQLVPYKEG